MKEDKNQVVGSENMNGGQARWKNHEDLDFLAQMGESDSLADKLKILARQNKLAAFSAVILILIFLAAVFAPVVAPCDHLAQSLTDRLQDPSAAHLLGTDELGRDVLSRIIFGARISLTIGLVPTLISMAIGTVLGLCAGFYGGKTDFIIMRLADVIDRKSVV